MSFKSIKNTILPFFVSLLPFALITGPFFSDLIVSLSSLVFLVYIFKYKVFNYINKKPLIFFFIFCSYCIFLSIFVAKDIFLSSQSSLFYFRIGIFACVIWYLIEKDKKILNYFYNCLFICFLTLIIDGHIQFFTGSNIFNYLSTGDRISSFFGDELILGSYLSRLFPLFFALFILKKKKKYEFHFMTIFFFLLCSLALISGERAAFVFYVLSLILITIFIKGYTKFRLAMITGSLIVVMIIISSFDQVKKRMILDPYSTIKNSIFTPAHDSLIRTAYKMFLDKPIVGHGPKMFRVICKDEKYAVGARPCMTHPHNFYIQLLAETGIIGFSFLLSVFIYVFYSFYRQFKSLVLRQKRYLTDYQVCLLVGILITVWPFTTNGNFFHNWLIIVYGMPVGFYLHSLYGKNKKEIYKNQN